MFEYPPGFEMSSWNRLLWGDPEVMCIEEDVGSTRALEEEIRDIVDDVCLSLDAVRIGNHDKSRICSDVPLALFTCLSMDLPC